LENLGDSASDDLRLLAECFPVEVESIQRIGEARTYDFEVEGTHKLWVDGFYVSNSRQGALMLMHYDWHPDILDFIDAKRDGTRLTGANLSVAVSDELMKAVENDEAWTLIFPETDHPAYDAEWDGDIHKWKDKGYPVRVVHQMKARELWDRIVQAAHASAEPGLFFVGRYNKMSNSYYYASGRIYCSNPCQPGWASVLTPDGIRPIHDVRVGSLIWSGQRWTQITQKTATGSKPVYAFRTRAGTFYGTENHQVVQNGEKVEVSEAETIDICPGDFVEPSELYDPSDVMDGLVFGDGMTHKASNRIVLLIGEEDQCYHSSEVKSLIVEPRPGIKDTAWEVKTSLMDLPKTYERAVPDCFRRGSRNKVRGFLRGLYSANGSVVSNRVTLKATSFQVIESVQEMLSALGIPSYYTVNKAHSVEFQNGLYECIQTYDLNIGTPSGRAKFRTLIGFLHPDKEARLEEVCRSATSPKAHKQPKGSFEIVAKEYFGEEPVFDLTVEAEEHTYWTGGLLVSNCGEQGIPPWSVCNLGHINLVKHLLLADDGPAQVDWDRLEDTVRLGVRFLDNVVDIARVPFPQQAEQQRIERRIGLGTMGLGEMLIRCHIRYGDNAVCRDFLDKLYGFICEKAYDESVNLAQEKFRFPACDPGKIVESGFCKTLPTYLRDRIREHGLRNVTVLSQAPTGCVAPDTLISTEGVLRPIVTMGDPDGDQWQPMDASVSTDRGVEAASQFYVNGFQPVLRVETRRGFSLTATPQHRIRAITPDGEYAWRRMDELQEGDVLCLKRGTLASGSPAKLEPVSSGNRAIAVLPSEMTVDLAELLGYYMGDGYLKDRGGIHLVVGDADPDLREYLSEKLKVVWGVDSVGVEVRQGCCVLSMSGYHVVRFLTRNGMAKPGGNHGEGAAGAFIPEAVLASGSRCIGAFLRGLFEADGCVNSKQNVTLASVSEQLVDQVQVALLGLGIVSTVRAISKEMRGSSFGSRTLYELRLLNRREIVFFSERVGFLSTRKRERLASIPDDCARGDTLSVRALCDGFYDGSKGLPNDVRQTILQRITNGALNIEFVRQMMVAHPVLTATPLGQLVGMDLFFDEVASIDEGHSDTFDLSVPTTNTYIANGFVSHNTVGTMMNTSTGIEPYPWLEWERTGRLGTHREQAAPLRDWLAAGNIIIDLPDWFVSAMDMTPEDHAITQSAIQRWVDSSISKTSNLPHDYTVEQVDQFYRKMYQLGCKGGTVYRDLSRDTQVLNKVIEPKSEEWLEVHPVPKEAYPMRAVSLSTSVGKLSVKLGYDPKTMEPFEVWLDVSRSGTIMAADREAIARLISLLLRVDSHVTPLRRVQLVIDQLQGIQGGDPTGFGPEKVFSVPDAVAKALSQLLEAASGDLAEPATPSIRPPDICPECHQATLYRAGGCEECASCGYSKC
jgi:ribonucleotide reductase alpha subunit